VTEGRQDVGFDQISRTIAIFPLAGTLLLPRGQLPLNIFEPRYLDMVRDAMNESHLIGMIQPTDPATLESEPEVYQVGCVGRIDAFEETEDNRFLITLTGLCRFQVIDELPMAETYRRALVSYVCYRGDLEADLRARFDRVALFDALRNYLSFQELNADWKAVERISDESLISSLSMICPFEPREKQALLEAKSLGERAEILTTLMKFSTPGGMLGDPDVMQ
jgi:Lon protease-like protein